MSVQATNDGAVSPASFKEQLGANTHAQFELSTTAQGSEPYVSSKKPLSFWLVFREFPCLLLDDS